MVPLFFRIGENTTFMGASTGNPGHTHQQRPLLELGGPYSGPAGPFQIHHHPQAHALAKLLIVDDPGDLTG